MPEQVDPQIREIADEALAILKEWRGSSQSLSRESLCARIDCDDRKLREALRLLRLDGYLVVAVPSGGYRFATCHQDVQTYLRQMKSRIKKQSAVVNVMERAARQEFGEPAEQLAMGLG
jgi:DNA-binding GntR family transcriptional regulator